MIAKVFALLIASTSAFKLQVAKNALHENISGSDEQLAGFFKAIDIDANGCVSTTEGWIAIGHMLTTGAWAPSVVPWATIEADFKRMAGDDLCMDLKEFKAEFGNKSTI